MTEYIAKIFITGVIQEENKTYSQKWLLNTISALEKDDNNKGIILFIDSPGGSVYESDEAYLALLQYQKSNKPVWAYMGSLAASGPITDFDALVGKTVKVCVVNFSKQTNNFVVSHKKYLEITLPSRVENELTPGLRVNVRVTGQSKNGLFCAIRDAHGDYPFASLMHRSTMSPDMESSFDKGEYIVGDIFMAYVHRIDWTEDGKYRIVIGDQMPKIVKTEKETEE